MLEIHKDNWDNIKSIRKVGYDNAFRKVFKKEEKEYDTEENQSLSQISGGSYDKEDQLNVFGG